MRLSVAVSTDAVASSSTKIFAFFSKARPRANSWCWPTLQFSPFSKTIMLCQVNGLCRYLIRLKSCAKTGDNRYSCPLPNKQNALKFSEYLKCRKYELFQYGNALDLNCRVFLISAGLLHRAGTCRAPKEVSTSKK